MLSAPSSPRRRISNATTGVGNGVVATVTRAPTAAHTVAAVSANSRPRNRVSCAIKRWGADTCSPAKCSTMARDTTATRSCVNSSATSARQPEVPKAMGEDAVLCCRATTR